MAQIKDILDRILADKHSSEIEEVVEHLPEDNNQAIKQFCRQFGYIADNPAWLKGALEACGSTVVDVLDDLVLDRRVEEQQASDEVDDIMRGLRMAGN